MHISDTLHNNNRSGEKDYLFLIILKDKMKVLKGNKSQFTIRVRSWHRDWEMSVDETGGK